MSKKNRQLLFVFVCLTLLVINFLSYDFEDMYSALVFIKPLFNRIDSSLLPVLLIKTLSFTLFLTVGAFLYLVFIKSFGNNKYYILFYITYFSLCSLYITKHLVLMYFAYILLHIFFVYKAYFAKYKIGLILVLIALAAGLVVLGYFVNAVSSPEKFYGYLSEVLKRLKDVVLLIALSASFLMIAYLARPYVLFAGLVSTLLLLLLVSKLYISIVFYCVGCFIKYLDVSVDKCANRNSILITALLPILFYIFCSDVSLIYFIFFPHSVLILQEFVKTRYREYLFIFPLVITTYSFLKYSIGDYTFDSQTVSLQSEASISKLETIRSDILTTRNALFVIPAWLGPAVAGSKSLIYYTNTSNSKITFGSDLNLMIPCNNFIVYALNHNYFRDIENEIVDNFLCDGLFHAEFEYRQLNISNFSL